MASAAATPLAWPLKVPEKNTSPPTRGVESLHQLALAADGGDGEAVGDRLSHRRDIRRNAADRLIPADVVAEAGDDLVEDQDAALAVANAPQPFEEFLLGQDAADVVRNRLQDDAGDLARDCRGTPARRCRDR